MTGDLVTKTAQVHEVARDVLDFWFGLTHEQHFAVDEALDQEIAARFGALHATIVATTAADWMGASDTVLAAIIVLDQFSRNMFRGSDGAFAQDRLAIDLTLLAMERGWDATMAAERRVFLYLPLMHAERLDLQDLSVAKYEALGIASNLDFARKHRDEIARFGRYPTRNAALGRTTTAEEQAFLNEGGGW